MPASERLRFSSRHLQTLQGSRFPALRPSPAADLAGPGYRLPLQPAVGTIQIPAMQIHIRCRSVFLGYAGNVIDTLGLQRGERAGGGLYRPRSPKEPGAVCLGAPQAFSQAFSRRAPGPCHGPARRSWLPPTCSPCVSTVTSGTEPRNNLEGKQCSHP